MAPEIRKLQRRPKRKEYAVDFFGADVIVTVTASPTVIGKWIDQVVEEDEHRFVGTGVQWSPPNHSAADTLQLCVDKKCLIVQLQHCSRIPKRLTRFLGSNVTTFAGIWNAKDSIKLLARSDALKIRNLVDVRNYMGPLRNCSVAEIVLEGLGRRITPAIRTTKSYWSQKQLNRDQILQATMDAHVSYKLALDNAKEN